MIIEFTEVKLASKIIVRGCDSKFSKKQMKHHELGLMKVMVTKNRGGPNYIKEIWNRKN